MLKRFTLARNLKSGKVDYFDRRYANHDKYRAKSPDKFYFKE